MKQLLTMKGRLLPVAILGLALAVLPANSRANITISLSAGYLRNNAAVALNSNPAPNGALLLLVASGQAGGTTFGGPVVGSYVSGGDVILGAASFNANNGSEVTPPATGKETTNLFSNLAFPTTVAAGVYVELLWFPNITLAQYNSGTVPGLGTTYGAYNPLVTNLSGNTTLNPDGGSPWVLPADNSSNTEYNLFTTDDQGGTQNVIEGYARFAVIPEPSTYAMLAVGAIGLAGLALRKRRVA